MTLELPTAGPPNLLARLTERVGTIAGMVEVNTVESARRRCRYAEWEVSAYYGRAAQE